MRDHATYRSPAVALSLTDDGHVCVLHEGEVAGRDGDLAEVGPGEVDLHVLDHHASLVGRSDLKKQKKYNSL